MQYFYYTKLGEKYPHTILLEPANSEGLVRHSKLAILTDEVMGWLYENVGEDNFLWSYSSVISFTTKEAAMGFMLRWA